MPLSLLIPGEISYSTRLVNDNYYSIQYFDDVCNHRFWPLILTLSIIIFFVFQILIEYYDLGDGKICHSEAFSNWTSHVMSFQSGAFLATFIVYANALVSSSKIKFIWGSTMSIGCVCMVSCLSSFFTFYWNWGGVCEDVYGSVVNHET